MEIKQAHIHLDDEGQPSVGSGWRMVDYRVGRKWVYIRELWTVWDEASRTMVPGRWKRLKRSTALRLWPALNQG